MTDHSPRPVGQLPSVGLQEFPSQARPLAGCWNCPTTPIITTAKATKQRPNLKTLRPALPAGCPTKSHRIPTNQTCCSHRLVTSKLGRVQADESPVSLQFSCLDARYARDASGSETGPSSLSPMPFETVEHLTGDRTHNGISLELKLLLDAPNGLGRQVAISPVQTDRRSNRVLEVLPEAPAQLHPRHPNGTPQNPLCGGNI
jgi:hypothetical protein